MVCQSYLALDEHVEEVITGFWMIAFTHQVPQVVMGNPQTWKITYINTLIIKPTALSARDQIKELFSLGGGCDRRI